MRLSITSCGLLMATMVVVGCSGTSDEALSGAIARYRLHNRSQLTAFADAPGAPLTVRSDAIEDQPGHLVIARMLAANPEKPSGSATEKPSYVSWQKRRGPAYPDKPLHSIGRDAKELPATLWDDTKAVATNPLSLLGIGLAGAAGIAINASGGDDCLADHYEKNGSDLDKCGDNIGDVGGNPGAHFAVAGAMYFAGLLGNDTKTYEVSKTLINALAINGLSTLAMKGIVRTRSPNDDPFGWPSGHTSSTFTLATVMYEAYGPLVGVPLFAFAGFVGYERVDARNHDFSDVISGALLGIAIGHAVARNHQPKVFGMDLIPYTNPANNSAGLALIKKW